MPSRLQPGMREKALDGVGSIVNKAGAQGAHCGPQPAQCPPSWQWGAAATPPGRCPPPAGEEVGPTTAALVRWCPQIAWEGQLAREGDGLGARQSVLPGGVEFNVVIL